MASIDIYRLPARDLPRSANSSTSSVRAQPRFHALKSAVQVLACRCKKVGLLEDTRPL